MLSNLTLADWLILSLDLIVLLGIVVYYYFFGTSIKLCRLIVIDENKLKLWRIGLYTAISCVWLIAIFTFDISNLLRFPLHLIFLVSTGYMLTVSLPSWLCKKRGYGGMCNCDVYAYRDFYPMLGLGIIGGLAFLFVPFETPTTLAFLASYILAMLGIFFLIPEKEPDQLKYPAELVLNSVDEFQAFLLNNPEQLKLITIVKNTCDFCFIQMAEIMSLPMDLIKDRLRIFDLSKNDIDPIMTLTLNIDDLKKVPVPSTRLYNGGMEVESKEGVLSSPELQSLLI